MNGVGGGMGGGGWASIMSGAEGGGSNPYEDFGELAGEYQRWLAAGAGAGAPGPDEEAREGREGGKGGEGGEGAGRYPHAHASKRAKLKSLHKLTAKYDALHKNRKHLEALPLSALNISVEKLDRHAKERERREEEAERRQAQQRAAFPPKAPRGILPPTMAAPAPVMDSPVDTGRMPSLASQIEAMVKEGEKEGERKVGGKKGEREGKGKESEREIGGEREAHTPAAPPTPARRGNDPRREKRLVSTTHISDEWERGEGRGGGEGGGEGGADGMRASGQAVRSARPLPPLVMGPGGRPPPPTSPAPERPSVPVTPSDALVASSRAAFSRQSSLSRSNAGTPSSTSLPGSGGERGRARPSNALQRLKSGSKAKKESEKE